GLGQGVAAAVQAGKVHERIGVGGRLAGQRGGAGDLVGVERARGSDSDGSVHHDAQGQGGADLRHVLMDTGVGETGDVLVHGGELRVGLVGSGGIESPGDDV